MARPDKKGIDYYPKDIDADQDDKLGMIIGEFGVKGELLFDKVCGWIYKHEGYYMKWEEDVQLRFLRRYDYCGFSLSFINEVVPRFIKWGLFDKTVFDEFQILTSKRIQETWMEASRKRTGRRYIKKVWLLEVSSGLQAEEMDEKAEETPQSKLKETKGNEIKEKSRAKALVVADATPDNAQQVLRSEYTALVKQLTGNDLKTVITGLKEFIHDKKPLFIEPYQEFWNLFAGSYGLAKVEVLSESRKRKFKTRISEPGFDFLKILEKIKASPLLRGKSGDWKVSFDWILENDNNYAKILNGNYD
jgi:hypothetical protein